MEKKRIAIVGSGISGLSTLWTLRNSPHEVHLFEKESRLGGHTNTATWIHNGNSTPVDTGFIVLNTATYRKCRGRVVEKILITNSKFHCLPVCPESEDHCFADDLWHLA